MKKIAQIEFYEGETLDRMASATVRVFDEEGNPIHGEKFPPELMPSIEDLLWKMRYIFGPISISNGSGKPEA